MLNYNYFDTSLNLVSNAIVSTQQTSKQDNIDHYKILEVPKNATQEEIRAAYLRLVKIWHPDKNPDPSARKRFEEIERAYRILKLNPIAPKSSYATIRGNSSFLTLEHHRTYHNAVTFLNQTLT